MYQRNIDLERTIQALRGPGAVQPRQCSIESSSDTLEEEAGPPIKRRRLMERELDGRSRIDHITNQLLSQSSQEKHSSLHLNQVSRPTPSVRHDRSPMASSSPTFNLKQTGSAFTDSALYASRWHPAHGASPLVQAGSVAHYQSSPHYSSNKQTSGPELMTPFQNGSIRRLSIDAYTPKTDTTATRITREDKSLHPHIASELASIFLSISINPVHQPISVFQITHTACTRNIEHSR